MKIILKKLEQELKKIFHGENSGHDINHLKRVLNLALHIQKKEGGDKLVIAISAFLHDVHRITEKETGKYCEPRDSLPKIIKLLDNVNLSEEQKKRILHCIEFHEEYNFSSGGKSVKDKETLIVQDADNLDAIGAVGIARAFAFGGANNIPIWVPELPIKITNFDEAKRDLSEIHHFYNKLLRLKDNMNTKTAKKMALERHNFMLKFLKEFKNEWKGEK